MTKEQIKRAVAEALGWTVIYDPREEPDLPYKLLDPSGTTVGHGCNADIVWLYTFDFTDDYNAAAEMRKAIRPEEQNSFLSWLWRIMPRSTTFDLVNATPRQQAEAFLRMRNVLGYTP